MADDLFHVAQVKVRRARKHVSDIAPAFATISAEHDKFLSAASRLDILGMGDFMPELAIPQRQLDEIACCVGDAVHNLRAALDLLAGEVVERSGASRKDVHFPFAQSAAELANVMVKGKRFDRARADAQALLLALKPHGDPGGNELLWGLHRLDLIDKHQDLLALSHEVQAPAMYYEGVRLQPADAKPRRLVFAPGDYFPGHEVVAVLDSLASETERTIQAFSNLGW